MMKNIKYIIPLILFVPEFIIGQWFHSAIIDSGYITAMFAKDNVFVIGGFALSDLSQGICYSDDYGETWEEHNVGFYNWPINDLLVLNEYLYAGTGWEGGGLYRSSDKGVSWEKVNLGRNEGVISLLRLNNYIFAGHQSDYSPIGISRSPDNGITWDYIYTGGNGTSNWCLESIDSTLFCGVLNGGIYASKDYGNSWSNISDSLLNDAPVTTLISIGDTLFAGTNINVYEKDEIGILYTTDFGTTWNQINNGLTNLNIYDLVSDGVHLFALTIDGIFMKQLNDNWWHEINFNLPAETIRVLSVVGGYLYAGIESKGLWKIPINDIVILSDEETQYLPNKFEIKQNYPNPFNPTTKISYSVSHPGKISLIVYDVLGREVSNLVDEEKSAGTYTVAFDGANLSSGIYFYQMRVNDFVETKKMILLR